MLQNSPVPNELVEAYLAAHYRVQATPPFVLKIAQHSDDLKQLYLRASVQTAAFVTAWNPLGIARAMTENISSQEALFSDVKSGGFAYLFGEGLDPAGQWESEASLLILGLSFEHARALGSKYQQNAIVWCAADAIPQLLMLR